MNELEREIDLLRYAPPPSKEYHPPPAAAEYTNNGWMKDTLNAFSTGLWSYPTDPTTIPGVHYLQSGKGLVDGYYAYAYRVSDNRIAYVYTGGDPNTNNAVAHSYLASGGKVFGAGIFRVENSKIKRIDSASGHYLPDPKVYLHPETCQEETTGAETLEIVKAKMTDLGCDTSGAVLVPFRHPAIDGAKIECASRKPMSFEPMRNP